MIYGREPIVYITNAVGINTSNPASTLDVNGNINAMTNLQENYINLSNKYMKITNTTRKQCFTFTCPSGNLITINGGTYYKYDIDLRNYTNTFSSDQYTTARIFHIKTFLASCVFDQLSSVYNENSYEVFMSYKTTGNYNGLHIKCFGFPYNNIYLNQITGTQFLIRNDFNYLTYCSTVPNTVIACIIIDYL